jgi:hypothetical protein
VNFELVVISFQFLFPVFGMCSELAAVKHAKDLLEQSLSDAKGISGNRDEHAMSRAFVSVCVA